MFSQNNQQDTPPALNCHTPDLTITRDLLLMTLNYQEQVIDLSGAYRTKIFNEKTGLWQLLSEDLSKVHPQNIFGLQLPVIPLDVLITYKKALSREVDIIDVQEIEKAKTSSKL